MTTPSSAYTTRSGEVVTTTRRQNSTRRLHGAEKLLVMASDGEAGAGCYAWPPALSDREIASTRHAISQYLIEATSLPRRQLGVPRRYRRAVFSAVFYSSLVL